MAPGTRDRNDASLWRGEVCSKFHHVGHIADFGETVSDKARNITGTVITIDAGAAA